MTTNDFETEDLREIYREYIHNTDKVNQIGYEYISSAKLPSKLKEQIIETFGQTICGNQLYDKKMKEAEKITEDYKLQTACIKAIGHIREILKEPYTPSNVKVSMIETIIEGIK